VARPRTAFGWLMLAVLVLGAVMAVTGVLLATVWRVEINTTPVYADITEVSSGGAAGRLSRRLHRSLGWPLALAIAAVVVERAVAATRSRNWPPVVAAAALALTTIALSFTGVLLPWQGFAIFADPSRSFYIVDGVEIGVGTMRRWFLLHTVALTAVWAVLFAATWRLDRRSASGDGQGDAVEDVALAGYDGVGTDPLHHPS
jgi:hypothetical protein